MADNRTVEPFGFIQFMNQPFWVLPKRTIGDLSKDVPDGFWGSSRERAVNRLVRAFFHKGELFLDIGAHYGEYSVLAAMAGMFAEAFEPNPDAYACLERNLSPYSNAFCHRAALGACNDTYRLIRPQSAASSALVEEAWLIPPDGQDVMVRVETLDGFRRAPSLIKVDVEGWAFQVLLGGAQTLADHYPRVVIDLHRFYANGAPSDERRCAAFLTGLGYDVYTKLYNESILFASTHAEDAAIWRHLIAEWDSETLPA